MLDEINNQKLEIERLKSDNERLAQIVHKDNKLIPAMEMTVTQFLQNSEHRTTEEITSLGIDLSAKLHEIASERQGILTSLHKGNTALPQSGLQIIDGLLAYMATRADKEAITYKVQIDENIKDLISNAIQEEDLRHLLGDLIENAIIACRHSANSASDTLCTPSDNNKAVSIHLGALQDYFLLEISDSGIPFTPETYQRFGNEKYTTHKDEDGSGIGLTDIWKIKRQYRASLQIYEYPPETNTYTKKISFIFDRKNHFLLQTYRHKEITYSLTRGDLYVFPYESAKNINIIDN